MIPGDTVGSLLGWGPSWCLGWKATNRTSFTPATSPGFPGKGSTLDMLDKTPSPEGWNVR